MHSTRRNFLKTSALALAALPLSTPVWGMPSKELFKISLAQWSLHRLLFAGEMDNLDFAAVAAESGILGLEYVNQFFMDKAEDTDYLNEMKKRADDLGSTSILIMCDREGNLGDPDADLRRESVERHVKWLSAAKHLGCHSIRVNGYSEGSYDEQMKLVADGLHQLCEIGEEYGLHVIIENHGGYSSNGKWLADTIKMADHPRAGTLPDFGNFRIDADNTYDSYRGVEELMPYATGVSVKTTVFDDEGNSSPLDYERMTRIVLAAGYNGYFGIEHSPADREIEEIREVKAELEAVHELLMSEMDQ
ncbi:MAG: sugar phosphate isomerase/epimerase [Bacteroidetes bacterium]|nr:sugar phosphate isomerase/epimerase [Bacteroidota bacterium]